MQSIALKIILLFSLLQVHYVFANHNEVNCPKNVNLLLQINEQLPVEENYRMLPSYKAGVLFRDFMLRHKTEDGFEFPPYQSRLHKEYLLYREVSSFLKAFEGDEFTEVREFFLELLVSPETKVAIEIAEFMLINIRDNINHVPAHRKDSSEYEKALYFKMHRLQKLAGFLPVFDRPKYAKLKSLFLYQTGSAEFKAGTDTRDFLMQLKDKNLPYKLPNLINPDKKTKNSLRIRINAYAFRRGFLKPFLGEEYREVREAFIKLREEFL
jgi:hypothetical protein